MHCFCLEYFWNIGFPQLISKPNSLLLEDMRSEASSEGDNYTVLLMYHETTTEYKFEPSEFEPTYTFEPSYQWLYTVPRHKASEAMEFFYHPPQFVAIALTLTHDCDPAARLLQPSLPVLVVQWVNVKKM